MPPLKHKDQPEPVVDQTYDDTPNRKGSLFSRRHRSASPNDMPMNTRQTNINMNGHADDHNGRSHTRGRGFFSRRSHSSSDDSTRRGSARSGSGSGFNSTIYGRHLNDPTILAARQKVNDAEEAERQADRSLVEARASAREAKQHVKNLEREIEEEARTHKMKLQEAKQVSKSAKGLGRHG